MYLITLGISEEKLDEFIKTRKSFKMTAKSAQATSSGITGKVDYAIGKATLLLDVVLEKVHLKLSDLFNSSIKISEFL